MEVNQEMCRLFREHPGDYDPVWGKYQTVYNSICLTNYWPGEYFDELFPVGALAPPGGQDGDGEMEVNDG